ncbi:c-type cytochrome [Methylohalobius crimeensis]|uniref:c-type cytochrome n=1 Tax=Methylohalobius crimeensis TaxID=244365 RepID=UPI000A04FB10|nr:cytochrome c [Methylohalobius crimeensis]
MKKTIFTTLTIFALHFYGGEVGAADAEAGEKLARSKGCAGCHGANGISPEGTSYPNLAGQKEVYLSQALTAYREKSREVSLMNGMAASLSDEDIANLAAYFSSLSPCP